MEGGHMKKVIPLKTWKPGIVTNTSDYKNIGFTAFQNLSLNSMEDVEKPKGFRPLGSLGDEIAKGIYIARYLGALSEPIPQFDPSHVWYNIDNYDESTQGLKVLDTYIVKNNPTAKQLIRVTIGTEEAFIDKNESTYKLSAPSISTPKAVIDWQNDIQFISTKDNAYIINNGKAMRKNAIGEYRKNNVAGTEYKSGYPNGDIWTSNYYAKNCSLYGSMNYSKFNYTNTESGAAVINKNYLIAIVPILNSGTICPISYKYEFGGRETRAAFVSKITMTKGINKLKITINKNEFTLADEHVIGYRIYRTIVGDYKELTGGAGIVLTDDLKFYFMADAYKKDLVEDGNTFILSSKLEIKAPDFLTGTPYVTEGLLNTFPLPFASEKWYTEREEEETAPEYMLYPTCGQYIDNRLFVNNKYDTFLYMSELDRTDAFPASLGYQLSDVTKSNPITAIAGINKNVFVFTATSIDMLRPTTNPEAPYIVQNISHTRGCGHWASIAIQDNIVYFVYGNTIWSLNVHGAMREVGANIADKVKEATDTVRLTKGDNGTVNVFIRLENTVDIGDIQDYKRKHYIIHPLEDTISERLGKRDKLTFDGTVEGGYYIGTLESGADDYIIVNGEFTEKTNSFYGVTKYGELVVSDSNCDYTDKSLVNALVVWGFNARWDGVGTFVDSYNVESKFAKPYFFGNNVILNTIILIGSGRWLCSLQTDQRTATTFKAHTLGVVDTGIMFNQTGKLHIITCKHDTNEQIDITGVQFKVTAQGRINIENKTSGGDKNG